MIPEITTRMMKYMKSSKPYKKYSFNDISLTLKPYAFPPESDFSRSTYCIQQSIHYCGERVLDVGTGAGILAMLASKRAKDVHAVDISLDGVHLCKNNCRKNKIQNVRIYQSNMFENVTGTFDTIIANLPIVENDLPDNNSFWYTLFDPSFRFHEVLFSQASLHLNSGGKILLCHADLEPDGFSKIESLAKKHDYTFEIDFICNELDHEWRSYVFKK
jgi:methylase of polypeptide subunit release factors